MSAALPEPATIGPDTPLRLDVAVRIVWPEGGMTVSGLRRERDRGRLITEIVAGKEFTTLRFIEAMRKLCRAQQREQGSTSRDTSIARPSGSSGMAPIERARAAAQRTMRELRQNFGTTSKQSTAPLVPVVQQKSR